MTSMYSAISRSDMLMCNEVTMSRIWSSVGRFTLVIDTPAAAGALPAVILVGDTGGAARCVGAAGMGGEANRIGATGTVGRDDAVGTGRGSPCPLRFMRTEPS